MISGRKSYYQLLTYVMGFLEAISVIFPGRTYVSAPVVRFDSFSMYHVFGASQQEYVSFPMKVRLMRHFNVVGTNRILMERQPYEHASSFCRKAISGLG